MSQSSNGSNPSPVIPGSDLPADVNRSRSRSEKLRRKTIGTGETSDGEVLNDDEVGEVVQRLHSPPNSVSDSPSGLGRRRSQNPNSSLQVGDPLSDNSVKTLDGIGQGSDAEETAVGTGETFDVEAGDLDEVEEEEVAGHLPVVVGLNKDVPLSHQIYQGISGYGATQQERAKDAFENERRRN